jgi:hypothetical protein
VSGDQTGRDPTHRKLVEIVDNEPEWAMPALVSYFKRIKAGDSSDAAAQIWRDERAAAEAAHVAE